MTIQIPDWLVDGSLPYLTENWQTALAIGFYTATFFWVRSNKFWMWREGARVNELNPDSPEKEPHLAGEVLGRLLVWAASPLIVGLAAVVGTGILIGKYGMTSRTVRRRINENAELVRKRNQINRERKDKEEQGEFDDRY